MSLFCVGIVYTNLYNCISSVPTRNLEPFDTASHGCVGREEWNLVIKTLLQYSSLTLLAKVCYEEEVQPIGKMTTNRYIYTITKQIKWIIHSKI